MREVQCSRVARRTLAPTAMHRPRDLGSRVHLPPLRVEESQLEESLHGTSELLSWQLRKRRCRPPRRGRRISKTAIVPRESALLRSQPPTRARLESFPKRVPSRPNLAE